MLSKKITLLAGAFTGGLAVALGAFGAHALKALLLQNQAVDTYTLAVQYQFYHALALLVIGILMNTSATPNRFGYAALSMLLGVILFSGSLYALALTGTRSVVLITPLGGLFFLAGWGLLIWAIAGGQRKQ